MLQLLYYNTSPDDSAGISLAVLGTNLTTLLQNRFDVKASLDPTALHNALERLTGSTMVVCSCDGFHFKLSRAGRAHFQSDYEVSAAA